MQLEAKLQSTTNKQPNVMVPSQKTSRSQLSLYAIIATVVLVLQLVFTFRFHNTMSSNNNGSETVFALDFFTGEQFDTQDSNNKHNNTQHIKSQTHIQQQQQFDTQDSNNKHNDTLHIKSQILIHQQQEETVLILTPLKDASQHLNEYFDRLVQFKYPKSLTSLGFVEGDSSDNTYQNLLNIIEQRNLSNIYNSIIIGKKSMKQKVSAGNDRHGKSIQLQRRSKMAIVRNHLLSIALQKEQYVFWLDSDVIEIPTDILETMIHAKKPIVVANCMFKSQDPNETPRSYDLNSWVETSRSLELIKRKKNNELVLEGYGIKTHRKGINDLRGDSDDNSDINLVVELNGVGGTALLVEANIHRDGINFPSYVIDNAIETEGLCRLAERNAIKCYGMPNLQVWHR